MNLRFEHLFENTSEDQIVEQFLTDDEVKVQHPLEIYSMAAKLDVASEEDKETLMEYITDYAGDIREPDTDSTLTGDELAESIRDFCEEKEYFWRTLEDENYDGVEDLVEDQVSAYLADRLRYMPEARKKSAE